MLPIRNIIEIALINGIIIEIVLINRIIIEIERINFIFLHKKVQVY